MGDSWTVVMLVSISTMALKSAGPVALGGRELPPRLLGLVAAMAPALLAALVVTQTLDGGRELVLDDRLVGVGVAAALIALRVPVIVVVFAAAAATAAVRAV